MDNNGEIPQYVDDPPQVLLWSAEELAPVALGMAIGIVIGKAMLLTLLGLGMAKLYRTFNDRHPDGYLLHLIYWCGFIPSKSRTVPNPFIRRFLP